MEIKERDYNILLVAFLVVLIAFLIVMSINMNLKNTKIIDECDEVGYEVDYRTKDFIVCRNEKLGKSYIRAKHEFIEEWCSYI